MQLDELKKRIDNLTIGLKREEALEIFTFLTKADFDSTFVKSKIKKERWDEFEKVKLLLDQDSRNAEGQGVKHAGSRLFDCTVKLDLVPSSEKAESKIVYPKSWLDFEETALIADNLFDKQKTAIDEIRLKQLRENPNASLHSFVLAVFNSSLLLPFQKQKFENSFPKFVVLANLINKLSLTDQNTKIEEIFKQAEKENKKSVWPLRKFYEILDDKKKDIFNKLHPEFGSWYVIEAELTTTAEQQTEIDIFLEKNYKSKNTTNDLIKELVENSKKLTEEQKAILSAYVEPIEEEIRSSKRKRTPSQKAKTTEQNSSKAEASEEESFEKKSKKNQSEVKPIESLSKEDRQRIITQMKIAVDAMWKKKSKGKKFKSSFSKKFQEVDENGYLVFKLIITPDALCKTDDEKMLFGRKVEFFLKTEFSLQQNDQTSNFKLIEGKPATWNKYCVKSTDSERCIGLTLTPEEWDANQGGVAVRGTTTATISEKLDKLKKSKKSAKKTSIVETSEIPEHESSAPPSSPQDLFKESKSKEHSEDEQIEDAPPTPDSPPTQKPPALTIDLEGISGSDKESWDLFEKWKKKKQENQQKRESITKYRETFHKKSEELKTEKQKIRAERKRRLTELYSQAETENVHLTQEEKQAKKDLDDVEIQLSHYRSSST